MRSRADIDALIANARKRSQELLEKRLANQTESAEAAAALKSTFQTMPVTVHVLHVPQTKPVQQVKPAKPTCGKCGKKLADKLAEIKENLTNKAD